MFIDAVTELIGFIASFLATGAVAFRFVVLRADAAAEPEVDRRGARRAAILGFIGAAISALMYALLSLPNSAARQHKTLIKAAFGSGPASIQTIALGLLVIGLALAMARVRAGWVLAAAGVIAGPFANLVFGSWNRSINPIHRLSGGVWIGTLFILLVAGFNAVQHSGLDSVRRGALAANMVHRFSPLALIAFAMLAFTGVNTAWRHLKHFNALWTTSYGYALIAKLVVVLVVVSLGAWNWRRQRPLLGTESAAAVLQRSASYEVTAATVVLVITAVLVSLPSPK